MYHKSIIYLIVSSMIYSSTLFAFEFGVPNFMKETKNAFSKSSTINTFNKICKDKVDLSDPSINIDKQWGVMCKIVRESDTCKEVKEEDRVDCNSKQSENEIDFTSWNFISNCGSGIWKSIEEMWDFLKKGATWAWNFSTDSDKRSASLQKGGEMYNMAMGYLAVEYEKERAKSKYDKMVLFPDSRASFETSRKLLSKMFSKIGDIISTEFYQLGCYNKELRAERTCKVVNDILFPPVFAIGLLMKGPKILKNTGRFAKYYSKNKSVKKSRALVKAQSKLDGLSKPVGVGKALKRIKEIEEVLKNGSRSEKLAALDKLKKLKIKKSTLALTSKNKQNQEIVKLYNNISKLIENTADTVVRKRAVESIASFTKSNLKNGPKNSIMGMKSLNVFEDIYLSQKYPDSLRKIAHEQIVFTRDQFKLGDISPFENKKIFFAKQNRAKIEAGIRHERVLSVSKTHLNKVKNSPEYINVVGKLGRSDQDLGYELMALIELKNPLKSKAEIIREFNKKTSSCPVK